MKTKRCYYCKGIYNFAICNEQEKSKQWKPLQICPSSSKEMILLQTVEVYVANERNNKEIKLKLLFDSGSEKCFCHNVLITVCSRQQFVQTTGKFVQKTLWK